MGRVVVVVDFHKPSSADIALGKVVRLLGNVNAVGGDADGLGEEVKADVACVEHYLHGLHTGCPSVHQMSGNLKAQGVAQLSEFVVSTGHQCKVFRGRHAEDVLLLGELQPVGFLFEPCPGVIPPSTDGKCHGMFLIAHGSIGCGGSRAVLRRHHPGFGGNVVCPGGDGTAAFRTDEERGKSAADEASGRCHPVARGVEVGGVGNECAPRNHGYVVDIFEGLCPPFVPFTGNAVFQRGDALGPLAVGECGVGKEIVRLPFCRGGDVECPKGTFFGPQADNVGDVLGRCPVDEFYPGILCQSVLKTVGPSGYRQGWKAEGKEKKEDEDKAHGGLW